MYSNPKFNIPGTHEKIYISGTFHILLENQNFSKIFSLMGFF